MPPDAGQRSSTGGSQSWRSSSSSDGDSEVSTAPSAVGRCDGGVSEVRDLNTGAVLCTTEVDQVLRAVADPRQLLKRDGWWRTSTPVVLPPNMFRDDTHCRSSCTPTATALKTMPATPTSPRQGCFAEPRVTLPQPNAELTFIRVSGTGTATDPQGSAYTVYFLDIKCPRASPPLWRVHRRYKEFRALDDDLRRADFNPPPLPPRKIMGLLDPALVCQRREELEAWLYQLIDVVTVTEPDPQSFEPFRNFLLADADNPPFPMEVNRGEWEVGAGDKQGEGEMGGEKGEWQRVGLADFEPVRVIGKGSFGKVTLVRKRSSGALFAMKALAKSHLERSKQVEHTRTERHVLGRVNHPFIVGMHYAWTTDAKVYFVLDYCAGGELFFHLSQRRQLPEYMARFYAAEITLALEHLHSCNVAYRDMKPEK